MHHFKFRDLQYPLAGQIYMTFLEQPHFQALIQYRVKKREKKKEKIKGIDHMIMIMWWSLK